MTLSPLTSNITSLTDGDLWHFKVLTSFIQYYVELTLEICLSIKLP